MWHVPEVVKFVYGKRPLGIHMCSCEDNFKMEFQRKYWRRGLIWLRIETDGVLFSTTNFGDSYKVQDF